MSPAKCLNLNKLENLSFGKELNLGLFGKRLDVCSLCFVQFHLVEEQYPVLCYVIASLIAIKSTRFFPKCLQKPTF